LDVVEHGVNGWLVEAGDVAGLSKVIVRLLADGELRRELGENGRQTILTQFTPERELTANLALYQH
jgi:glycosyltransferase involved in cell wall biosynthesis